jgi:OTU domain-containing protein 6
MAGSKRKPKKKTISPPPIKNQDDDDDLMNELFAQLDSRDETVQAESATVIHEIKLNEQADANGKEEPRNRFKARQVCARYCSNHQIILHDFRPEKQLHLLNRMSQTAQKCRLDSKGKRMRKTMLYLKSAQTSP